VPYPIPSDYQEALQFPDAAFLDPELAAGLVATNTLGLPQPVTGAFAAVFDVETSSGRFAVRCFLSDDPNRGARYAALSRHLRSVSLPALAPFEYQERGVRVGESVYPLVKMPWVEGESLESFVGRHHEDARAMLAVRGAWEALMGQLEAAHVAHGDLQHGNVLVSSSDLAIDLVLIDFDAMWVPALRSRHSPEVGHRNYQHPDRTERDVGRSVDHFPALVVYTALAALTGAPDLWNRFSTGENLLFQAADFFDPEGSPLFETLNGMATMRPLSDALRRACYLHPAAVPSLGAVLSGEALPSPTGHRRTSGEGAVRRRTGVARWGGPGSIALVATILLLIALGYWLLAMAAATIGSGAMGAAAVREYSGLSPVRRRRRLRREAEVLERWIAEIDDERSSVRAAMGGLAHRMAAARDVRLAELQDEALRRRLAKHFVSELSHREGVGHRAVVRLKVAGVRDAFQATGEAVHRARGLSTPQRTGIAAWREELVRQYAEEVPTDLSAGEEQRIRRQIERRTSQLAGEMARLEAKAALQCRELEAVTERLDTLPAITPIDYVAYLFYLRPLPKRRHYEATAPRFVPGSPGQDGDNPWWQTH
jgi:hypothetical protein